MKRRKKYVWSAFGLILLAAIFLSQSEVSLSGAEKSRFSVIEAVGEEGVFAMDGTLFYGVDRVEYRGKNYSDKPLVLPWSLGLVYRVCRNFGLPDFREEKNNAVYGIDLLFSVTVNFLFFLWLFHAFCRIRAGSMPVKWLLALAGVFGTWMVSYGTVVNNHTPAALAVLGLAVMLEKFRKVPSFGFALTAGVAAGLLGTMELPFGAFFAAATLIAVGVSAPAGKKMKSMLAVLLGGGAMLAGMLLLNGYAYGNILPLYIISGGSYQPPSPLRAGIGNYGWQILFGARGLFSYQPFLLLGVFWAVGSLLPGRERRFSGGLTAGEKSLLGAALASTLFYWFFTDEYGGWGYGFRYLIPVIPLFVYWGGKMLLRASSPALNVLAALLILWGVITSLVGSYAPYCPAYEGSRTPPGHFLEAIQSTFAGNLLLIAHRHAPESPVFSELEKIYGVQNVRAYLFWATLNAGLSDETLGITNRRETIEKLYQTQGDSL